MKKMPWLKLHTEIRTDPKMLALNDMEFRIWIYALCLAADSKGAVSYTHLDVYKRQGWNLRRQHQDMEKAKNNPKSTKYRLSAGTGSRYRKA